MSPIHESLRDFCDRVCQESWNGYATAFRAGAKARLTDGVCNYLKPNFQEAWNRGFDAVHAFLAEGNTLEVPEGKRTTPAPSEWRGPADSSRKHRIGVYVEDCGCEHCIAKRNAAQRKADRAARRLLPKSKKKPGRPAKGKPVAAARPAGEAQRIALRELLKRLNEARTCGVGE